MPHFIRHPEAPGPVIAIVGPTASGKSALADLIAQELGAPVLSVDAMQVYKEMNIGVAKTPLDARPVPLKLVDIVDLQQDYSVQEFQQAARKEIKVSLEASGVAIMCGGTGLYLNATTCAMNFPQGHAHTAYRAKLEAQAQEEGSESVWKILQEIDPASAKMIHPNNTKRVIRALEMAREHISYAEHSSGLDHLEELYHTQIYGISWPREILYERINARVNQMIEEGLIDEVKYCIAHGLLDNKTASQAIGYKEFIAYLNGTSTLDEAITQLKQATRRYAKRQLSWFRHDERVEWLDFTQLTLEDAAQYILATVDKN